MSRPVIYISYRQYESKFIANELRGLLQYEYADAVIHIDLGRVPLSQGIRTEIDAAVAECDVMLVLIGDNWLAANPITRNRHCDEPHDQIRFEIESALQRRIPLIPLLVGNARPPEKQALPESIRELSQCQSVAIGLNRPLHEQLRHIIRMLGEHFQKSDQAQLGDAAGQKSHSQSNVAPASGVEQTLAKVFITVPPSRPLQWRKVFILAAIGTAFAVAGVGAEVIASFFYHTTLFGPWAVLVVLMCLSIYGAVTIRHPLLAPLIGLIPLGILSVAFTIMLGPSLLGTIVGAGIGLGFALPSLIVGAIAKPKSDRWSL